MWFDGTATVCTNWMIMLHVDYATFAVSKS